MMTVAYRFDTLRAVFLKVGVTHGGGMEDRLPVCCTHGRPLPDDQEI